MFRRMLLLALVASLVVPSAAFATWPGPAGRILFDRYDDRAVTHPILTMLPNGTSQRQVYSWTSNRRVFQTDFSANGRFLVFGQSTDTQSTIQRMTTAGTGRVVLQSSSGSGATSSVPVEAHWSPSGELWFERVFGFTHADLYAPGGRIVTRMFEDSSASGAAGTGWAFSPDGSQVVYEKVVRSLDGEFVHTERDLWIIDADGTDDHRLTSFGDLLDRADGMTIVHWGRGGYIYFSRTRPGTTDWLMQRVRPDGSDLATITVNPKQFAVSPNGRSLAYVTNAGALVATDALGGNRRVLARNAEGAIFSPDSTRIAFAQSIYGGNTDVVTIRTNGLGRLNLTNTGRFSEAPLAWARIPPTTARSTR